MVNLPVRCVWGVTANNPEVSTDIARRSIPINLDPQCSRPWERTDFKHPNLLEFMDKHRGSLVRAALILVRAWISSAQPLWQARTLGSYEQWSAVMGGILEVNGVKGFLENLDAFYEASDTEGYSWEILVSKWWERFHQKGVGARELFPLALECDIEITGNTDRALRTSFGVQLRNHRDQVIGKFKIIRVGQANRAIQWSLKPTHLKKVEVGHGSGRGGGSGSGDGHGHGRGRGVSINPDDFEKASAQ